VLVGDIADVQGLVDGNGAGRSVPSDVHAEEVRQIAEVFDFEPPWTKEGLLVEDPLGVVGNKEEVINTDADHGEDVVVAEDVDAMIGYALHPSVLQHARA
jgi:hypothetical protein